jgi:hypothetical protein
MYFSAVKLTRSLFWTALIAGILALLFPHFIDLWIPVILASACAGCFAFTTYHVATTRRHEYRCPVCRWVPFSLRAWKCKKCKIVWDSFSTAGACPACHHQHEETVCVRCRRTSKNVDWSI